MQEEKKWDFDSWAEDYDESVAAGDEYYMLYDEVLDEIARLANVSPGSRILDIGTGTGNLAIRCRALGCSVVGLDPSQGMLKKARQKVGADPEIELRQSGEPFLHIPYENASFDAVVSSYAYHHVAPEMKRSSVYEIVRVLKTGGVYAIGDIIFESEEAERQALQELTWLEEEHFARIDEHHTIFGELGMKLHARQFTPVTWILWTNKSAAI